MGLHGLLRTRSADLVGIVNGIDDTVWDPASDPNLAADYDVQRLKATSNRAAIQERFGLAPDPDALLCIVPMSLLLVWRHGANIRKLVNGTESKIGHKASAQGAAVPAASARKAKRRR